VNDSRVVPLTRGQLAVTTGLSETEIASCERSGALVPTLPGRRSTFEPAGYTPLDATAALMIAQAHRSGLRGKALAALFQPLRELVASCQGKVSGWVLVPPHGSPLLAPDPLGTEVLQVLLDARSGGGLLLRMDPVAR